LSVKPSVLFVCVHNTGRSQMASGLLTHLAGDRIEVRSAGTERAHTINPGAIAAMAELGIDIAGATPQLVTPELVRTSDIVITMGCGDLGPHLPGIAYRDWKLDDPAGQPAEIVRAIRDAIAQHVQALIDELFPSADNP
ncbi:arsenate reductase ArsC, partial [Mycobacterium ahvazicum]